MESGSLLPEALEWMRRMRDAEEEYFLDGRDGGGGCDGCGGEAQVSTGEGGDDDGDDCKFGPHHPSAPPRNALIISLYPLTPHLVSASSSISSASASDVEDDDAERRRAASLRSLASLSRAVNGVLLPRYRSRYSHPWTSMGIECPAFGPHVDGIDGLPHLRAVVQYGHSVIDEWAAVAIAAALTADSEDERFGGGARVAAECWDVDDGHVLLIEAAEHLPGWVEEVGAGGCRHRCWMSGGRVHLVPPSPSSSSSSSGDLGRADALRYLAARLDARSRGGGEERGTTEAPEGVQRAIKRRIGPFLDAIRAAAPSSSATLSSSAPSASSSAVAASFRRRRGRGTRIDVVDAIPGGLREHLHRCALVLPLPLARAVTDMPDLAGAAVMAFCRHEGGAARRRGTASGGVGGGGGGSVRCNGKIGCEGRSAAGSSSNGVAGNSIPFENLVLAVVMFTRTTYALLMTGAGSVPSPFPLPREYRSVELKRMRRLCNTEGMRDRLRYSLEGGVRLCRGFEWLLRREDGGGSGGDDSKEADNIGSAAVPSATDDGPEARLRQWMNLDVACGGDGSWIRRSWSSGPNATPSHFSLDPLLSCPLYDLEIRVALRRGALRPLSRPGISPGRMVREALRSAEKEGGKMIGGKAARDDWFGVPGEDDVDDDSWLDVRSADAFDRLLSATSSQVGGSPRSGGERSEKAGEKAGGRSRRAEERGEGTVEIGGRPPAAAATAASATQAVDDVLRGLKDFVSSESGVEGVATASSSRGEGGTISTCDDTRGGGKAEIGELSSVSTPDKDDEVPWWDRPGGYRTGPNIDPEAFQRILRWALEGEEGTSPPLDDDDGGGDEGRRKKNGPGEGGDDDFFSREDYEAFLGDGEEGSSDSESDGGCDAEGDNRLDETDRLGPSMTDIMEAMDAELRGTKVEHGVHVPQADRNDEDGCHGEDGEAIPAELDPDDPVAADVAVLTNLLESLDAQGAGPGPASNLLGEMGIGRASE